MVATELETKEEVLNEVEEDVEGEDGVVLPDLDEDLDIDEDDDEEIEEEEN